MKQSVNQLKTLFRSLVFASVVVGIMSCGNASTESGTASNPIAADQLGAYIREISSDYYLGRKPFTEGEKRTVSYLISEFQAMGLQPGNGDKYTQDVPLIEITGTPSPQMQITRDGEDVLTFNLKDDYVAFTYREQEQIDVRNSELIFCGFGVVAPEYGWNDFDGIDMKGKTAVVLVNDPGFGGEDSTFFKGNTMTYYGRWTYKYEEAERQGAEAIMIIHETTSAGYPWFVVQNGWSGAKLQLQSEDGNPSKPAIQGWFTLDAARRLFEAAGLDLAAEIRRARTQAFTPVSLGMGMNVSLTNTFKEDVSQNVVARIEGTQRPDETIIYTAHWDHLGIGIPVDGDSINNGAIDNATGVAALLSIAKAFTTMETKPERSVIFLMVTAEEQGLLGSEWYARNPIYPINKTVANLNIDAIQSSGETNDLIVVGHGHSQLDEYAEQAAAEQGRVVVPDQEPEKGFYFRSDHFNFAKVGVPALYAENGVDHKVYGEAHGRKMREDYTANRYHKPSDEYDEKWDLGGLVQDVNLYFTIGKRLASETDFPQWKEGSEFRNVKR